jgi:RNA polymerase sigma factor (sigma-70 family)
MSPRISIRLLAAQSDQRLLTLVNEGHERAFEALVQRYRRPLLRYCRRLGLSDARAEDALQHALLQAWLSLERGAQVRELKAWLYRVVHNAAVNAMRGAGENHSELTEAAYATAARAGESELERRIAVREALTDVAALPQMQRQAIFLTAVDGQTHDEVADTLGISEGALRGLLYRARATLRSAAAAFTPTPLLQWAAGGRGTVAPMAERLAELSAGGGAAGATGLLLKGAVVAVTAGALASGAAVVDHHGHASRRATQQGSSLTGGRTTSGAATPSPGPLAADTSVFGAALAKDSSARRGGDARHGGRGHTRSGGRRASRKDDRDTHEPVTEEPAGPSGSGGQSDGGDGAETDSDVADVKGAGSGTSGSSRSGSKKASGKDVAVVPGPEVAKSGGGDRGGQSGEASGGSPESASGADLTGDDQTASTTGGSSGGSKGGGGSGSDD